MDEFEIPCYNNAKISCIYFRKGIQKRKYGNEVSMFRLWAKVWKENHLIKDMVVENTDTSLSRTKKVFAAIETVCYEYNLSKPIWLESSIRDFQRHDKTRFSQDNFVDQIDFDFLEIHVIEED